MALLRRLQAGELPPAERDEVAAHVASCAGCAARLRELGEEQARLRADVPFETFAAEIAQRTAPPRASRRTRLLTFAAPLAAAASIAVVAAVALRPTDDPVRSKGGATIELFAQEGESVHAVASGDRITAGTRLLPAIHGVSGKRMRVTLIEPGESSVLYDGPAREGPLSQAFEWTGSGTAVLRLEVDGASAAEVTLLR
jgi:hypothetical protein